MILSLKSPYQGAKRSIKSIITANIRILRIIHFYKQSTIRTVCPSSIYEPARNRLKQAHKKAKYALISFKEIFLYVIIPIFSLRKYFPVFSLFLHFNFILMFKFDDLNKNKPLRIFRLLRKIRKGLSKFKLIICS